MTTSQFAPAISCVDLASASPATTDALLVDGSFRQALVAVRSLGRAGLKVAVAEAPDVCDPSFRVPPFSSRWSTWHSPLPSYKEDPDGYSAFLLDLVGDRPTRVLLPSGDGSIAALRPWRSRFEREGVALALASEAALEVANDKSRTLAAATGLGILSPRSAPIERPEATRDALNEVGYPAVIKPTQSWVRNRDAWGKVACKEVLNESEAIAHVECLHELGSSAIAQQWVGGAREAVSCLYAQGRLWAEFAQVAHRMTPVLGGVSVVRESIPMPADLRSAALGLVEALQLEGCCEVEFRRDAAGRPLLMEINARLSGSVEIAVRSGVDLPTLLWRWAAGETLSPVPGYRTGVRMRYLEGDIDWLWENLKSRGRPDSVPPWKALRTFAGDFLRPQAYDYVDRRDLRPAVVAFRRDAGDIRRRLVVKAATGTRPVKPDFEPTGV
jgi:predicted ATP-grasp superfamily ATP-dependent carboligase